MHRASLGERAKIFCFPWIVVTQPLTRTTDSSASEHTAPASAPKRIGEILIERGKLDAAGLERALRLQQETHEKLGALLVTLGIVAQRDVAEALATQLDLPLV